MKNRLIKFSANSQEEAEASKLGLNFQVAEIPVFRDLSSLNLGDLPMRECVNNKAICHKETGFEYGVVGKDWNPFQPDAFFDAVAETLRGFKTGKWEASQVGGKLFIDVELSEHVLPVKKGDIISYFARFGTALDGTLTTINEIVARRLICLNGMTRMVKQFYRKARHTKNADKKIQFNLVDLANMIEKIPSVNARFTKLANVSIDGRMKEEIIAKIFPAPNKDKDLPKQLVTKRETVLNLVDNGRGNSGNTLWDVFNGITEYTTHHANTRETRQTTGEANRFLSANIGPNVRLAQRAFAILESYAD